MPNALPVAVRECQMACANNVKKDLRNWKNEMSQILWVTRNKRYNHRYIELVNIWESKPTNHGGSFLDDGKAELITSFYRKEFNRWASKPIKPGECRKFEIVVTGK